MIANTSSSPSPSLVRVVFVAGSAPSGYGATSPLPNPTWFQVAQQLAKRLPHFVQTSSSEEEEGGEDLLNHEHDHDHEREHDYDSPRIVAQAIHLANDASTTTLPSDTQVVLVLGVHTPAEQARLQQLLEESTTSSSNNSNNRIQAVLCDPTCAPEIVQQRFAGTFHANTSKGLSSWQSSLYTQLAPWTTLASHRRLLQKTDVLLARKSSEDYLFAILFTLHSLVTPIHVVKSDINPSWEKGPLCNVQEFASMIQCCGPQIQAALTDPQSKKAIDLLNDLDLRDQVGSYRVIVSNETPQLEDFTLCILQQNNCFQCDSPILQQPQVPLISQWRGQSPIDHQAARQILMGHLDHPDSVSTDESTRVPWSWKIVVGANPAYDAFPMQHQIFYPSGSAGGGGSSSGGSGGGGGSKGKSLWYDPVFCVETLEGDLVWCKRHYRCTPRRHWSQPVDNDDDVNSHKATSSPGAWTLTTLDNGMVSKEHWTTVDAADDLSWTVLHYSGAARRAGQSYVGALLCSPDGHWPASAPPGSPEWDRIETAFRNCGLELWELFGGSYEQSYMWSTQFTEWAKDHPPPLNRIGDMSITTWRKRRRALEASKNSGDAATVN